ncbi:hypothetical protein KFE98_06740 [bacterium SCSIO 12741]|nr:hypothetical protein KFE98_06740 [bacterium SCSIO 12741]
MKSAILILLFGALYLTSFGQVSLSVTSPEALKNQSRLDYGLSQPTIQQTMTVGQLREINHYLSRSCYTPFWSVYVPANACGPIDNPWCARTAGDAIIGGTVVWLKESLFHNRPLFPSWR